MADARTRYCCLRRLTVSAVKTGSIDKAPADTRALRRCARDDCDCGEQKSCGSICLPHDGVNGCHGERCLLGREGVTAAKSALFPRPRHDRPHHLIHAHRCRSMRSVAIAAVIALEDVRHGAAHLSVPVCDLRLGAMIEVRASCKAQRFKEQALPGVSSQRASSSASFHRPIAIASCLESRVVARSTQIHAEDDSVGLPLGLNSDCRVKSSAAPSLWLGFQFRF
jgi:hypothetical protein